MPSLLTKDTVLPSLISSGIYRFMGETKEGHQVIQFQLKLLDPYAQELSDYTKYVVYVLESAIKKSSKRSKCVWIFDLEGWGMTTHGTSRGTDFTKEILVTAQNHYPERLHMAFIVSAPWLFSTAWSIISGWLDKKTQEKIKFLKSRKELHNYIDKSKLPSSYYGSHPGYPPSME